MFSVKHYYDTFYIVICGQQFVSYFLLIWLIQCYLTFVSLWVVLILLSAPSCLIYEQKEVSGISISFLQGIWGTHVYRLWAELHFLNNWKS